jgi:hypothetical protein
LPLAAGLCDRAVTGVMEHARQILVTLVSE